MSIIDLLSPLRRNIRLFFVLVMGITMLILLGIYFYPNTHKTSIFFTINPSGNTPSGNHFYAVEGAERMADNIAGWIKSPRFRKHILEKANIDIPSFHRKIKVRTQGRTSIFITLKLKESQQDIAKNITESTIHSFQDNIKRINQQSSFDFNITDPEIFDEVVHYPIVWYVFSSLMTAIFFSLFYLYSRESFRGKISFVNEVELIFPKASLLVLGHQEANQKAIITRFLMQFRSPELIGTFQKAKQIIPMKPFADADINDKVHPIIVVQLGETTQQELKNLSSIFGSRASVIIFKHNDF